MDATWPWLKKKLGKQISIRVSAWVPPDGQQAPGLRQVFTVDSLRGAEAYMKDLLVSRQASMVSIEAFATLPRSNAPDARSTRGYQPEVVYKFGLFELSE